MQSRGNLNSALRQPLQLDIKSIVKGVIVHRKFMQGQKLRNHLQPLQDF
jgi:hypothetical protein